MQHPGLPFWTSEMSLSICHLLNCRDFGRKCMSPGKRMQSDWPCWPSMEAVELIWGCRSWGKDRHGQPMAFAFQWGYVGMKWNEHRHCMQLHPAGLWIDASTICLQPFDDWFYGTILSEEHPEDMAAPWHFLRAQFICCSSCAV